MPSVTTIPRRIETSTLRKQRVAAYARVSVEQDRALHSLAKEIKYVI